MEGIWVNDAKQKKAWLRTFTKQYTYICSCMCAYVYILLKPTEEITQKLNKQTKKNKSLNKEN